MILRALAAVLCLLAGVGVVSAHEQPKEGACEASARQPAIVSARESLQRTPDALKVRLGLADLLIDAGCYDEAVHVLEDGTAIHARNEELQTRLRTARSLISERQFFDGLDQAELDAKLSRHVLRCTRFGDVDACDQALAIKPDNVAVVIARGDALLKSQRPLEALDAYRRATALDPSNADVATKTKLCAGAAPYRRTALHERRRRGGARRLSVDSGERRGERVRSPAPHRRASAGGQSAGEGARHVHRRELAEARRQGSRAGNRRARREHWPQRCARSCRARLFARHARAKFAKASHRCSRRRR